MHRSNNMLAYGLLCFWVSLAFTQPQNTASDTLWATPTQGALHIDGRLMECTWQHAAPLLSFHQREPQTGTPASFKTEVQILYDHQALYFGIRCYDPEPQKIIAKQLERDVSFSGDDRFAVILDTYLDGRNAFLFQVNPNGAKFDAYITDEGEYINLDWNGIWTAAALIDSLGWTAEIRIPFSTLKFAPSRDPVWGINFRRYIARLNEEDLWHACARNEGLFKISKAGILGGFKVEDARPPLNLRPYLLTGISHTSPSATRLSAKVGLDLKFRLRSSQTLNVTVHPDFAQVEVDVRRINLTRFSLFYPEKREFFVEGLGIFHFGMRYRCQPLYTRRIGLAENGKAIPILAGAKITGKLQNLDLGALDVVTGRKDTLPPENFFVLRLKQEVLRNSYFGMILTDRESPGVRAYTQGVDFLYSTSQFLHQKNLAIGGYYMVSTGRFFKNRSSTASYHLYADYPNDLVDTYFSYSSIGRDFDPKMGFVWRRGVRFFYGHFRIMPRIQGYGLKSLVFKVEYQSFYRTDGRFLDRFYEFRPLGFVTKSGDRLEWNLQTEMEYLDSDFEILKG